MELSRGSIVCNLDFQLCLYSPFYNNNNNNKSIIVRNNGTIRIIVTPLVYVETGFEEGASTRVQFNINGDIIGLRKWKVF